MLLFKKQIKLILTLILISCITLSSSFFNPSISAEELTKEDYTVAFIGGSITEGAGGFGTSYVSLVGNYFKQKYPEKNVKIINAGIGGTHSDLGMFRLQKDVLSHSPDVIFVEFAVNDRDYTSDQAKKYMEGILRQIAKLPDPPYVIMLYCARTDKWDARAAEHKMIADYYGIPSIDLQAYIKEQVAMRKVQVSDLFIDSVHPNNAGHTAYAEYIIEKLRKEESKYFVKPKLPSRPLTGFDVYQPRLIPYTEAKYTGYWDEYKFGDKRSFDICMRSNHKGDTVEFSFYGKCIGIYGVMSKTAGTAEYVIDGKISGKFDMYSPTDGLPSGYVLKTDLDNTHHKIVITVSDPSPNSSGNDITIGYFMVDDGNNPDLKKNVANEYSEQTINDDSENNSENAVEEPKITNVLALSIGKSYAYVNGMKKNIDVNNPEVTPAIVQNRTLVPIRFISESLGATVKWDEKTSTINISTNEKDISMTIDKNTVTVDGEPMTIDVPPQIIHARTFVPLRAIAELLDKQVYWDNKSLIIISDMKIEDESESGKKFVEEIANLFVVD